MKKSHTAKRYLLPLIFLSFTSSSLWAANQNSVNENFATMSGSGNVVSWSIHPSVHYQSIELTLTTPDRGPLVIDTTGEPVTPSLPDGGYNYEMIVTPSLGPNVRGQLKAARAAADGQEAAEAARTLKSQGKVPQHRQVQSGFFTILNGELVLPDDE